MEYKQNTLKAHWLRSQFDQREDNIDQEGNSALEENIDAEDNPDEEEHNPDEEDNNNEEINSDEEDNLDQEDNTDGSYDTFFDPQLERQKKHDIGSYDKFLDRLANNEICDMDVISIIDETIADFESDKDKDIWKIFYYKGGKRNDRLQPYPIGTVSVTKMGRRVDNGARALRLTTRWLNTNTPKLAAKLQAVRFIKSTTDAAEGSAAHGHCCAVDFCKPCTVLARCGHSICKNCLQDGDQECPVKGCNAWNRACQKIDCSMLNNHTALVMGDEANGNGTKINKVVSLIKSFENTEKAIVYVQHKENKEKLNKALTAAKIECVTLSNTKGNSSAKLEAFKKKNENGVKVLILYIWDATTAGR